MNRRSFFKVVTGFVVGIVTVGSAKEKPKLRDFDAHLVLGDDFDEKDLCGGQSGTLCPRCKFNYPTMSASAPFVQHNGIWFFADQDIIKYCPKDKLHWDNWESIRILFPLERYDYFDFWLLEEGKLFWCGEHDNRFEIIEDYEGRICIKAILV